MKGVGYKRHFRVKLPFLRYSTDGSGMIVELFSRRPFIKILFYRFTILVSHFLITIYFTGNFPEIFRNFFRNFSKISYTSPIYLTHTPIPLTPTPTPHIRTHSELQTPFSQYSIFGPKYRFFSNPFICCLGPFCAGAGRAQERYSKFHYYIIL